MGLTFKDILLDMKGFRDPSNYPVYPIPNIKVEPMVGMKSIMFQTMMMGGTSEYSLVVVFNDVQWAMDNRPGYRLLNYKGENYYYLPPDLNNNPIKIKCSCPDFRYTFSYQDEKAKSMVGQTPIYHRKTTTRPPRNPDDVTGVCKHLWSFITALKHSGYVR